MKYAWYEEKYLSDDITQGDIIINCTIPIPNISIYDAMINGKDIVEDSIEIRLGDFIILSQACDIENDKIDTIVLSPVWTLEELMKTDVRYKSSKAREELRQGNQPSYHLLHNYKSDNLEMKFSVVDFHQIYTLPKEYLKKTARNITYRIRLLPPYREHLSQAFARYFMRVGLPSDIPKDDIKNMK